VIWRDAEWFTAANGALIANRLTRLYLIAGTEIDDPAGDETRLTIIASLGLDPRGLAGQVIQALAVDAANLLACDHDPPCGLEQLDLADERMQIMLAEAELAPARGED